MKLERWGNMVRRLKADGGIEMRKVTEKESG